jgi:hypothetical protein
LRPCTELDFIPPLVSGRALRGAPESRAGTGPAAEAAPDLDILRGLRDLFATDPDGLRYVDLYYQHAAETGAIGLADPGLLWFAYLTLQDFLPGFEKVVAGHGDQVAITQAMVDQANHLADRLVAAGSPALGAAIDQERAAYDGLQDFVGLTFSEATELIGVPAPAALHALYLPVVPK